MATWEITEKTLLCGHVGSVVTVMVCGDGQANCNWHKRFVDCPNSKTHRFLDKLSKKAGRRLECRGGSCELVISYKDQLLGEAEKSRGDA